jgi:hypothetical protein
MANINRPKGLSPVQNVDGSTWSQGTTLFNVPAADTTNSYAIGDVVMAAAGADANGVSNVIKWTGVVGASTLPIGVVVGIRVADPGVSLVGNSLSLEKAYIPANTGVAHYLYVVTDPGTVFEIQGDSTVWAAANCNQNVNVTSLVGTVSGSAGTVTASQTSLGNGAPYSNTVAIAPAASNALPFQVVGVVQRPDNGFGAYAALLVRFNVHNFYGAATGRTGV